MSKKTMSWVDETTRLPVIETYASQLEDFVETFADGRVDAAELQRQESKLVELMREIEPELDDELHGRVTRLLCELTSYNIMRCFFTLEETRPRTTFKG